MNKRKKKSKRIRLEPLAKIRRRLMRLWTERVHRDQDGLCAVCEKRHGEVDPKTGKPTFMNAHHIEPRATCARLRYDPMNGILLCPSHHKFGRDSAHKGTVWFADWLQKNRPQQYAYILAHRNENVNVNDRAYLAQVEAMLRSEDGRKPEQQTEEGNERDSQS